MLRRLFIVGACAVTAGLIIDIMSDEDEKPIPPEIKKALDIQKADLETDENDTAVTHGFAQIEKTNSSLIQIRRSVAQADFYWWGLLYSSGSAVLLDNEGTVVLCGHQIHNHCTYLSFSPEPHTKCVALADIANDDVDKGLDIAFVTLRDVSLIKKFNLSPVEWGQAVAKDALGKEISLAGFRNDRLHATLGHDMYYEDIQITDKNVKFFCKILSHAPSFPGMSGGGVFCGAKFVGLLNTAGKTDEGLYTASSFTPVEAIREAYIRLFPNRAARAGIITSNTYKLSPTHPECIFKNRLEIVPG